MVNLFKEPRVIQKCFESTAVIVSPTCFLADGLTSIPAYRDAPCNETNRRYFEFKGYKLYKRFNISIYFDFSYIVYFP